MNLIELPKMFMWLKVYGFHFIMCKIYLQKNDMSIMVKLNIYVYNIGRRFDPLLGHTKWLPSLVLRVAWLRYDRLTGVRIKETSSTGNLPRKWCDITGNCWTQHEIPNNQFYHWFQNIFVLYNLFIIHTSQCKEINSSQSV